MIIAGEIKVLCRVLILLAFCAFILQTQPLMGSDASRVGIEKGEENTNSTKQ